MATDLKQQLILAHVGTSNCLAFIDLPQLEI
jgi:hypothetical protein